MTFRKLNHCKVHADDGIIDIDDAFVRMNGTSVAISEYDGQGRTNQVERLVQCVTTENANGTLLIKGISTFLDHEVHAPAADLMVTVSIIPGKGCKNCR